MPSEPWVKLLAVRDCRPECPRYLEVDGFELAVIHLTDPDRFFVVKNSCPHAGGNLAAGTVEGGVVTCPWHQWSFNLDSGECTTSASVKLHRYDCRIEDGYLYARLTAPS
ncbi:MAG: Rieske 2Fe-2S domain-containing protein [Planctomycetota bacterium]|nr:Rieske 2Fe-2S domain-containing protein [Planctomycetota bacterium]